MNESNSETQPEVSSNSTVSSTMKKNEAEDTSNFNIGSIMDETNKHSSHVSEKLVQSSCSPISTTQIISAENHQNETSLAVDASPSSSTKRSNSNAYNISNADTTTVQGNVLYLIA
jgi:hypothetical protein